MTRIASRIPLHDATSIAAKGSDCHYLLPVTFSACLRVVSPNTEDYEQLLRQVPERGTQRTAVVVCVFSTRA